MRLNFNKVICVNLASVNAQQLFSICEHYLLGFEVLHKSKEMGIQMEWIDGDKNIIAFMYDGYFRVNEMYADLVKKDYDRIQEVKPVKTPKMPTSETSINNYSAYLREGYDIRTPSMDARVLHLQRRIAALKAELAAEAELEREIENLDEILEVDAILDKIGKYGITSITKNERDFLDNN